MTPLHKFLGEVKARVRATTPGPWKSDYCGDVWTEAEERFCPGNNQNLFRTIGTTACGPDAGDAVFIAASRTDIEKLVAIVEIQKVALEEIVSFCHSNRKARIHLGQCMAATAAFYDCEKILEEK